MTFGSVSFASVLHIPHTDAAIPMHGGGERVAIGRNGYTLRPAGAGAPLPMLFAAGHVPQTEGAIGISRGQPFAVRRKGDRGEQRLFSVEGADLFARSHVPQTRRIVVAPRRERLAV